MPKGISGGAGHGKGGLAGRKEQHGREKWSASVWHLSIWLGPSIPSLTCSGCVCDGMSLVKTLVEMVQGDRLQNSNRIVIAAVTGRPAAPTSQERGRSYCMHLVGCNVERAWHGGQA